MLIATFGPTTAWVGKTIAFENDQFILEGHGPIASTAIVQYDEQGHLEWSSDGLRQWVYEQAAATTPSPPPPEESSPVDATAAASTQEEEPPAEPSIARAKSVHAPDAKPILVATFRDRTVRAGSTIVHDRGAFIIEGEGLRTATDVMEYDRRGQLVWADEGTRGWVGAKAARTVVDPVARKLLDKARQQYQSGKLAAAVSTLYRVEPRARAGDEVAARGTIALCTDIRRQADEKLGLDCRFLIKQVAPICGYGWVPADSGPVTTLQTARPAPSLETVATADADPQQDNPAADHTAQPSSVGAEVDNRGRLETARRQQEQGAYEAAVETLWLLDAEARKGDKEAAQGVIDLAAQIGSCVEGNLAAECADLVARSYEALHPQTRSEKTAADSAPPESMAGKTAVSSVGLLSDSGAKMSTSGLQVCGNCGATSLTVATQCGACGHEFSHAHVYAFSGWFARWSATIVDVFIASLPILVALALVNPSPGVANGMFGLVLAIWLAYAVACEAIWGRTIGKRLVGSRVLKVDEGQIGLGQSLVRNLFKIVGMLGIFEVVTLVCILASKRSQRVGDMVAGTIVVREMRASELSARASDDIELLS